MRVYTQSRQSQYTDIKGVCDCVGQSDLSGAAWDTQPGTRVGRLSVSVSFCVCVDGLCRPSMHMRLCVRDGDCDCICVYAQEHGRRVGSQERHSHRLT